MEILTDLDKPDRTERTQKCEGQKIGASESKTSERGDINTQESTEMKLLCAAASSAMWCWIIDVASGHRCVKLERVFA